MTCVASQQVDETVVKERFFVRIAEFCTLKTVFKCPEHTKNCKFANV